MIHWKPCWNHYSLLFLHASERAPPPSATTERAVKDKLRSYSALEVWVQQRQNITDNGNRKRFSAEFQLGDFTGSILTFRSVCRGFCCVLGFDHRVVLWKTKSLYFFIRLWPRPLWSDNTHTNDGFSVLLWIESPGLPPKRVKDKTLWMFILS